MVALSELILPWLANRATALRWPGVVCLAVILTSFVGCLGHQSSEEADVYIWGKRGITEGRLQKPRAAAIDGEDRLYLVDMTARIQVFDVDGNFLRGWRTPVSKNGRPSGLSFDRRGRLLVADTHYYQMLVYDTAGKMIESATIGGTQGHEPGNFGFVTDAVEDSKGNFYVAEYGDFDRVQKFSPKGQFLLQWGGHGSELGQFRRPQNMAIDAEDHLWIVDACNHRIQVFDEEGNLLKNWGEEGSEIGKLYYPYDLVLDGQGHLYVCEYGNHRVQKFTLDGKSLGVWGSNGKGPGQLHNPWALVQDSKGRLHVLDSNNHRVQRFVF
ncbi:MAG: hypothetical protein GXP26_00350 [Planctomycetes bacterium]|nr:hypothetical protein [Planctomycetota bacterium]